MNKKNLFTKCLNWNIYLLNNKLEIDVKESKLEENHSLKQRLEKVFGNGIWNGSLWLEMA